MERAKILAILVLALSLMVCPAKVSGQTPLGTAFTYQGFLTKNGKIVDDKYDLEFRLFDANVGGTELGMVSEPNFRVIDGHIALELDFGGDVFTGDRRWLQTSIRRSGKDETFTDLGPRLELTLTPYTLYALSAESAEDANTVDGHDANNLPYVGGGGTADYIPIFTDANTLGHSVIHQSAGNIGIGTTSPTEKLGVVGNARIDGTLTVTGSQDIIGVVTATDGFAAGGTAVYEDGWIRVFGTPPSGNHDLAFRVGGSTARPDYDDPTQGIEIMRLTEAGNLGIGTPNPSERLHVDGSIRIVDGSEGANRVLTSNANGVASWQAPSDSGVPSGVIVMWSGASIPAGWALCDGGVHNGVQTPDLRDMFIVGAGSSYSIGATGGEASHTLTVAEMPSHSHPGLRTEKHVGDASPHDYDAYKCRSDGTTGSTGGDQPHENRPPYYALAYIMKLP